MGVAEKEQKSEGNIFLEMNFTQLEINHFRSSLVAQSVKDLTLLLLWRRFNPWPRNFCTGKKKTNLYWDRPLQGEATHNLGESGVPQGTRRAQDSVHSHRCLVTTQGCPRDLGDQQVD